jgi:hypothetical protein
MKVGRREGLYQVSGLLRPTFFSTVLLLGQRQEQTLCALVTKCQNIYFIDKRTISIDLCKTGYMSGYEMWVRHGEDPPLVFYWKFSQLKRGTTII